MNDEYVFKPVSSNLMIIANTGKSYGIYNIREITYDRIITTKEKYKAWKV